MSMIEIKEEYEEELIRFTYEEETEDDEDENKLITNIMLNVMKTNLLRSDLNTEGISRLINI